MTKVKTETLFKDFTVKLTGYEIKTLIELAEEGYRNTNTGSMARGMSIKLHDPIKILKNILRKENL